MKKIYCILFLFIYLKSLGQTNNNFKCATDELHYSKVNRDKKYIKNFDSINRLWQDYVLKKADEVKHRAIQTNPVTLSIVFHDLTNSSSFLLSNTSSSINDYQYIIDKLNLIFDGTNLNGTPGNNTNINFCLAQKDVKGDLYTFEMSRFNNVLAAENLDSSEINQLVELAFISNTYTRFPTDKYINIYIVDAIQGEANGFATLPSSHGSISDGIYIERHFLENNININANMNVLAHEMGHYLGLFHTFGICKDSFDSCSCDNTNCLFNGDMICDTPPNQKQLNLYSLGNFPNTCTDIPYPSITDGTHPIIETVDPKDNYMDYGISDWQYKFTSGQIQRMNFMIDSVYGPRKSLLGSSSCFYCSEFNNCDFTISPNVALPGIRHEIIQTSTGTPAVQFNPSISCNTLSTSTINYHWKLVLLGNPDQIIFQNILAQNYTTTSGLLPGNYKLILSVSLQANQDCVETAFYYFSIFPKPSVCNAILPENNTSSSWTSNGWQRSSSENGWIIIGGNYPQGSTQYTESQIGDNNAAFDVLPIAPGGAITNDINFSSVLLPSSANINKIIRVGKRTQGGGKAYYAKMKLQVTSSNCRYRIWYLGLTEGDLGNIASPFLNNNIKNEAAFGWVCQYNYNSPVNTITSTYNTTIGSNDTTVFPSYDSNDMISLVGNIYGYGQDNNGAWKTYQWLYKDVDFSEFVNLSTATEITFTFFAHSNIANPSFENAYGYYGIECLGGGVPSAYSLNINDISLPCNSPFVQSCGNITVPLPKQDKMGVNTSNLYNFQNIKLYKKLANGQFDTNPYLLTLSSIEYVNSTINYELCLEQSNQPFQEFKIVSKTMHTTVEDTFRVYIGYYNNLIDCTSGDKIDEVHHPNLVNGNILVCGSDILPILHLTETCITEPHTYKWYNGLQVIPNATSETLQLTEEMLSSGCNYIYRETLYKEPYCGNEKIKRSDEFHVFTNRFQFSGIPVDGDICLGDNYVLKIFNPSFYTTCELPSEILNNLETQNNLTFQMVDPQSGQDIGNAINFSFTGLISNGFINNVPNPLVFTFDNINSTTGNYQFLPPEFDVNLKITGTYLDCPVDMMFEYYQHVNFRESAIGGRVEYNCVTGEIENNDSGMSNEVIYGWEYSIDGDNFYSIPNAPTTNNLQPTYISAISNSYSAVYIRRVSYGFADCPNSAYSNVVIITDHPDSIVFDLPSSICSGSTAPILSTLSDNGIKGNWNVLNANNSSSATYIFTPLSGYCLPNYLYHLEVIDYVTPIFNQIPPICVGQDLVLPTISNNGITGTWFPSVDTTQTTTYTFTPISTTCINSSTTMTVEVRPYVIPSFNLPSSFCFGSTPPVLPTISLNGIHGTWNPSIVSYINSGTYTFTPSSSECAETISKNISVQSQCTLTLEWSSDVSCQQVNEEIKFDDNIVDGPCIRVCQNSMIKYTINGNISNIQSTEWLISGGTLVSSSNTSCEVIWGNASFTSIQVIVHYTDGNVKQISRCIEKLNGPDALFSIYNHEVDEIVNVCLNNTVVFKNLTTHNNGNENIYYVWDFGDGTTSTEFEPTHIYTSAGQFIVKLTAYNGCSCIGIYKSEIIVDEGFSQIQCPSVACEGQRVKYSLPYELGKDCKIEWQVSGGTVVSYNDNRTEVSVIWDHVGVDGFGTVTASSYECFKCSTSIKIPIIKNQGVIKGKDVLCANDQGLYSLPQWPTTLFQWSVEDGGTGAYMIFTNQRNEITLQAQIPGTVIISCTYFNTLLGCGGSAQFEVEVKPRAVLGLNGEICVNNNEILEFFHDGTSINNINWSITGPNNFSLVGNSAPVSVSFNQVGNYTVSVNDNNYCLDYKEIKVVDNPLTPSVIEGPSLVCPGISVNYSTPVPENTIAHWEVENGTIIGSSIGSEVLVNFDPLATTPYLLKLRYEKKGCLSNEFIKTISKEIPIITFNVGEHQVCGSTVVNYSINPINVDNYVWSINPPNAGSIKNGQNTNTISILWNQLPGTAQIKLEVRKCGVTYLSTYDVTVLSHGEIVANIPENTCINDDYLVSFNVLGTGTFTTAVCNFGDGTPPVTLTYPNTTFTHQYTENLSSSTTFNVSVKVNNAGGCPMPVEISKPVIVSPKPIIQISPSISDFNYCDYSNSVADYTFTVNIQNGFGSTNSIKWFKNQVMVSTDSTILITNPENSIDEYYAVVTNSFGCSSTTNSFRVFNNCNSSCEHQYLLNATATLLDCQKIKLTPTLIDGSPISVYWTNYDIPNISIIQNDSNAFIAQNIDPGEYSITLVADYDDCLKRLNIPFIIPYKAGLKYDVQCANNGLYNVTLFDHSIEFPNTLIEHFAFTYDGGTNWYSGNIVNDIPQLMISLPPGTYNVGVKVWRSGYPPCTKILVLNLPAFPIATFTTSSSGCQYESLQFTANDITPGLSYQWNFADGSLNLQQNPVKSFSTPGIKLVTLTVTNSIGCSATFSANVIVRSNNIKGDLKPTPINTCVGGNVVINYESSILNGVQLPTTLYWYHNSYTITPFAVTHAPNLSLSVTQPGQYFAYAKNQFGCMEYMNITPTSVDFIPGPSSPVVTAPTVSCLSNQIYLDVPDDPKLNYIWLVNDNLYQFNGDSDLIFTPVTEGIYTFEVYAQVQAANGQWCSGTPTTHTVVVSAEPEVPQFEMHVLSCNPYQVQVNVSNPVAGAKYYWSNGTVGITTISFHDGPLQVRVEKNGCSITAQMDLPVDLESLAWIFPKGCQAICNEEKAGYIIGPLGDFEKWIWMQDGEPKYYGADIVFSFYDIIPTSSYQLYLATQYCETIWSSLSVDKLDCKKCSLEYDFKSIKCVQVNTFQVYEIEVVLINNSEVPMTVELQTLNGEGYFVTSSLTLSPGVNHQVLYFFPAYGFNEGTLKFSVTGIADDVHCFTKFVYDLPSCSGKTRQDASQIASLPKENVVVVAPNPAKTQTTVHYQLLDEGVVSIELYDLMGSILWQAKSNDSKGSVDIDCEQFSTGLYTILVKQNGHVINQSKLLIE